MAHLADRALAQTQVIVHRDFHSRNLMVLPETLTPDGQPGILDFQDAVVGPLSYDLVSLLRDAYVVWDEAENRLHVQKALMEYLLLGRVND